jgi:hypothetical protein
MSHLEIPDSGAGAPGRNDEIEITPEMIEAGEDVLLGELGGAVTSYWSAPELAKRVFEAMASLDRQATRRCHKQTR